MQRLTLSGEVIRLGLGSTHLAVVQVIAAHTRSSDWHLQGEGDGERLVSGEAYPTLETIAETVGKSERQVGTVVRQLAAAGLLQKRMETQRKPDALAGTIVLRRNFYRVSLPLSCAADGANGVREALAESPQLRISRPDTRSEPTTQTSAKLPTQQEVDFRSVVSKTSGKPSVPSYLSAAAAAPPAVEETRCEGIPMPDGTLAAVRLLNPPSATHNGSGVVVATGETVAIPLECWNLAHDGRGSGLRLESRNRGDGSTYRWMSRAPERRRGREDSRRDVLALPTCSDTPTPAEAVGETLTAEEVLAGQQRNGGGTFIVVDVCARAMFNVQVLPRTINGMRSGTVSSMTVERTAKGWRESSRVTVTEDDIPFFEPLQSKVTVSEDDIPF